MLLPYQAIAFILAYLRRARSPDSKSSAGKRLRRKLYQFGLKMNKIVAPVLPDNQELSSICLNGD